MLISRPRPQLPPLFNPAAEMAEAFKLAAQRGEIPLDRIRGSWFDRWTAEWVVMTWDDEEFRIGRSQLLGALHARH